MINPVCATCLYLPGLVLPTCRVSLLWCSLAKENVARIITLPKAEQHAWWAGYAVGLIGKADFTKGALRYFL